MRILVIDAERCGLDFCLRCISNGHTVKWFRKQNATDGQGFGIDVVSRWQDHMKWADLVLTTGNAKYLFELDDWRRFGAKNVMAPSVRSAALEINRQEGMKLFEAHGFNMAPYKTFNSLNDAKRHVMKTDQNYAFKPMGDDDHKDLTFVSSNPAQMCEWLDDKIKRGMALKGPCMLQEKLEFVAEIGIAGWMGPDGFLPDKWELSFEHKKLASGNYGCNTGETGTAVQYVKADPLVDYLKALEQDFRGAGHLGDANINGCVTESGDFYPFELTMRLGWPDFFIRTAMHKGDLAEQFKAMLDGKDSMRVSYDPYIGVVCAQRPYPYSEGSADEVIGKPIYGLEEVWDDVHPCQMMMSKGYVMAGESVATGNIYRTTGSYVLVATGSGSTMSKARRDVYKTVGEIKLSDMLCRDDIGEELETELPKLHRMGYAKAMTYE